MDIYDHLRNLIAIRHTLLLSDSRSCMRADLEAAAEYMAGVDAALSMFIDLAEARKCELGELSPEMQRCLDTGKAARNEDIDNA